TVSMTPRTSSCREPSSGRGRRENSSAVSSVGPTVDTGSPSGAVECRHGNPSPPGDTSEVHPRETSHMSLEAVLAGLHANPSDELGWLAIADCLEEQGEMQRAQLARLSAQVRALKGSAKRTRMVQRARDLLA